MDEFTPLKWTEQIQIKNPPKKEKTWFSIKIIFKWLASYFLQENNKKINHIHLREKIEPLQLTKLKMETAALNASKKSTVLTTYISLAMTNYSHGHRYACHPENNCT